MMLHRKLLSGGLFVLSVFLFGCTPSSTSTSTSTTEAPVSVTPVSGAWDFAMSGETGLLTGSNCPTTPVGFGSGGPSTLTVGTDGLTASLDIDGTVLAFTQTAPGFYQTAAMDFPVQDGSGGMVTGSVYYDMTVVSETEITGELHWDNTLGCQGNYPFTLSAS